MPLQSVWFRGNARLQQCLVSDPSHVQKGDRGDHVTLIQDALVMLDNSEISGEEKEQQFYGQSTANAVLEFKKKRKIINFSYQKSADNIVGRMTIRALDTEMLAQERAKFRPPLAFGVNISLPKIVILTEPQEQARLWASQVEAANKPNVVVILAPGKSTPEKNVEVIKKAITTAGSGGLLIFNVGHGFCLLENRNGLSETGAFDIAPDSVMRIEGKNMDNDPSQFVNVFHDDKPPQSLGGGLRPLSQKDLDERSGTDAAKRRLKNFSIYRDLSKAFVAGKLEAVLLATCRVGRATGLLKKVATQWKTPIIAYRDQWMFFEAPSRRIRAIMAGDKGRDNTPTPGTNTPFGEVMFPLSPFEMVQLRP